MFVQIFQGRCNREDELRTALDRWRAECEPGADGWLGATYGFTDDGRFAGVVRFESEDAARANSARPEQDRWWQATRDLFEGPVEFHDCRDVSLMLEGGSDDAGFVQIMQGKVDDPARMKAVMQQSAEMLHDARPEVIGGTLAIEEDGTFTDTVFFTDEATARANEGKEMPPEMRDWEAQATMHDVRYMDLHHPFFASHS